MKARQRRTCFGHRFSGESSALKNALAQTRDFAVSWILQRASLQTRDFQAVRELDSDVDKRQTLAWANTHLQRGEKQIWVIYRFDALF